jgi:trimeric autotransporter adhesin
VWTWTAITVTAYPAPAYQFHHWEGDLSGNANPAAIDLHSDKSVTAVFVQSSARYSITSDAGSAGGRVGLKPVQPIDGYPINTRVIVTAIADSGYVFSYWQGDLNGTTNPGSVTVDGDKAITAFFKPTVDASVSPPGAGVVNLDPDWVLSGYAIGTEVRVTATPAKGYRFDHWGGDLSGSANPTTMVMDSPKDVTAIFVEQKPFTFAWWWIVVGAVLLLAALIVVRVIYVMVTRRAADLEG